MQRPATSHSQKINEQIRKQLLPRTDKLKQMISLDLVPQSDQQMIIIPCLQKTLGFKTNQYGVNKQFLEGYISRMDFNGFVRKCNKIVEEEVIRKTKKENESFFGIISTLLKISIVIAILTFFLLATIVFFQLQEQTTNIILILAGILLASASMIAAVCPIVIYNSKYETINYEEKIKTRLQTLTQLQNQTLVENGKKHLNWEIQKNFFWIELHIDQSLYEDPQNFSDKIDPINEEELSEVSANNFLRRKSPKNSDKRKIELVQDL